MASILNVDKVRATGSTTDGLLVDSSGRVTTPARPSCFAYVDTSDSSDTDYTSVTQVDFDAVQHNIGGHFDLSTNKFTAPVSGVYQFNWQVRLYQVQSASTVNAQLRLNGLAHWGNSLYVYGGLEDPQGGHYASPGSSVTVQIDAGDEIDVWFNAAGDTTVRLQYAGTFFSGFLVG